MGSDLSLGATMGLASVAGAVVMAGSADRLLLGGSPLWGTALPESFLTYATPDIAAEAAPAAKVPVFDPS